MFCLVTCFFAETVVVAASAMWLNLYNRRKAVNCLDRIASRDLTQHATLSQFVYCLQLRVRAADNGVPTFYNDTTFTIRVVRNLHTPIWNSTSYTATILSTHNVSAEIPAVRLHAYDLDSTVSLWNWRFLY